MLKNCVLPSQYNLSSFKTCGEIICQSETSFTIVCKFCDIKIFEFDEFVEHFRNVHWPIINRVDENNKKFTLQKRNEINTVKSEKTVEEETLHEHFFNGTVDDSNEWIPEECDNQIENDGDSSDTETIAILKKKLEKPNVEKQQTFKCSLCQYTFTNKSNFESHIRKHETDQFKCDKCSLSFANKTRLTHHLVVHNGYPCKICTKVFKSYDSLRYHKETHIQTKNFECDFNGCNKAFVTRRRLNVHKRVHFPELFVCEVCGSRQRNKQALTDHIRKHTGEKPFSCNICDRRFTTNSLMNEHKACHETERKHVCDVCGKSFNRPKALYHHKPLHLGIKKFVCKLCGSAYAQAAGLSAHMRKHKEDKITILETNTYNELNINF